MPQVACEIVRWVDDSFPGWVEARLVDAYGVQWCFVEKAPVLSAATLTSATPYPVSGVIRCMIIDEDDALGRTVIDTSRPDGVTAIDGYTTRFFVSSHRVGP